MKVPSARKQFALVAVATVAGLGLSAGPAAAETPVTDPPAQIAVDEPTCPKDGKVDVIGSKTTVTVVAPEGMLISGYCVKAGSIQQGDGPETVMLVPPVAEITFGHSTGKDVSHYTVFYVTAPVVTPPGPDAPGGVTPGEQPTTDMPGEVPGELTAPLPVPETGSQPAPGTETEVFPAAPLPESGPLTGSEPAPAAAQAGPAADLPATGSTTSVFAALAAAITAAGFGVLRIGRRTV